MSKKAYRKAIDAAKAGKPYVCPKCGKDKCFMIQWAKEVEQKQENELALQEANLCR